jgi:AcrR family transcriptional regulator
MRVRSEEKRQEIIRIAAGLFEELGYERTSMSAIAARVGGSKATLYGYFSSKEELLRTVLDQDVNEEADRLLHEFLAEKDLRGGLSASVSPISRGTTSGQQTSGPSPIGRSPRNSTRRLATRLQRLADRLATMMKEGRLKFGSLDHRDALEGPQRMGHARAAPALGERGRRPKRHRECSDLRG